MFRLIPMLAARIQLDRISNARGKRVLRICLVLGTLCTGVATGLSSLKTDAQESRAWMIPGSAARGLSGRHNRTTTTEGTHSWMPDADESDWDYIVVHHSATESGSVESIHEQHLKRTDAYGNPWLGIGYHFLIGNGHGMPDGTVRATFRWNEQIHGAHSGNLLFNTRGIGICVIGNFENAPPSKSQLDSLKSLVKFLAVRHQISPENLVGHSSIRATVCPGKHFPLNEIRQVIPKMKY